MAFLAIAALLLAQLHAAPISSCRLPNKSTNPDVALGFPRIPNRMTSTGLRNFTILFVDFSDAPASLSPADFFAEVTNATSFFDAASFGALEAVYSPFLETLRMPNASTAYTFSDFYAQRDYLTTATSLAAARGWDFSYADSVVVMAAKTTKALLYGPAFCAEPNAGYKAGTKYLENSATSGADFWVWQPLGRWSNHELGHTMGLVDLYAFSGNGEFRYTGEWSIMSNINGRAPGAFLHIMRAPSPPPSLHSLRNPPMKFLGYFAWERWLLGWLPDTAVACEDASTEVILAPLNNPAPFDAQRLAVVLRSATTALCIEYRTVDGVDSQLPKEGVLVSLIDTAIATGEGVIKVLPIDDADESKLSVTLASGESLTFEGVTVMNTGLDPRGYARVTITVS